MITCMLHISIIYRRIDYYTEMGQRSESAMFDVSIYAEAHLKPSLLVPLVRATPETLARFGKLVPDFNSEQVTRVTWPKAGWRQIAPGTGNHQVRVTSSPAKCQI